MVTPHPLNENYPHEQCPAQDNCQRLPPNSGPAVILEAAELIGHQACISSCVVGLGAPNTRNRMRKKPSMHGMSFVSTHWLQKVTRPVDSPRTRRTLSRLAELT